MATPTPPPPSAAADILAGLAAYPGSLGAVFATGDGSVVRSTLADPSTAASYAATATRLAAKARPALRSVGRAPAVVAASAAAAAAAEEGAGAKAAAAAVTAVASAASGGAAAADQQPAAPAAAAAAASDPPPPLLLRVRTRKGGDVTVAPVWGEGGRLGQCLVAVQKGRSGGGGGEVAVVAMGE